MPGGAIYDGGSVRLLLLWMRIIPDLGLSAIREHLSVSTWLCPAHVRLRWVLACMFGFGTGALVGEQFSWLGEALSGPVRSLWMMLILGLLQSAWALKRPSADVLRWMAATSVGMFVLALPFRLIASGFLPNRLLFAVIFAALCGVGIGLLQFLMLPRSAFKTWRWIPANALGALGAVLGIFALVSATYFPFLRAVPFIVGTIFGCVTCIPLESMLRPKDVDAMEGVVE